MAKLTSKLAQYRNQRGWMSAIQSMIIGRLWLRLVTTVVMSAIAPVTFIDSPVEAMVVEDWKLNPNTGTVEVLLPEGIIPQLSVLPQPGRFILDLPQTEVGVNVTEFYENSLVRQVSLTQLDNQIARLTVDFAPGVVLDAQTVELQQIGIENLWIVRPEIQTVAAPQLTPETLIEPPAPPSAITADSTVEPSPTLNESMELLRIPSEELSQTELLPEESTLPPTAVVEEMIVEAEQTFSESAIAPPQPGSRVIPYGQPIPKASEQEEITFRPQMIDQSPPTLLLAAGDTVTLRYPSPVQVPLMPRPDRQEVLLLQGGIVDRQGQFIIPPDTPVIGRFETSSKGSRFVAVAINLEDRTIPFAARSEWIEGDRDVDFEDLALESGIAGLGGLLVSGFSGVGLLVGAVGGAAFNIFTSPEPTTLLPGQLIEVQLEENLPSSEFVFNGIDQAPPFIPTPGFN
ncbi:MAG: AMIN domain-containing protein [Microcoleaceae cyanobacterium]